MASEDNSGGEFHRRIEQWTRDSAELRAGSAGALVAPEEAALQRYARSTAPPQPLPHPAISPQRYADLTRERSTIAVRLLVTMLAMPLVVTLAVLVDPLAASIAVGALLLPLAGFALHQTRALTRVERTRHLALRGGLAEAWADWGRARQRLEALGSPSQARAALAANEPRMQAVVLSLAQADNEAGHQDTAEQAEARAWVFGTAAKATALAQAEEDLAATTRRQLDVDELLLAPDGDDTSLDHALDSARALNRGPDHPELEQPDQP
jgi:hypothetical protein